MKNMERWKPTKFVYRKTKLSGSRNPEHLSISSRLNADLVAAKYEHHLKDHASGSLVDLGCGKVPFYEAYRNYVSKVTCADWNSGANPYLDVTCDLNAPLPFGSDEFDTIILSDVLEHIAEPGALWKEMSRILKQDGKIILSVPFYYKLHEVPFDYFRYTRFALTRFAETNRFNVLVLEPIGGFPEIITDLMAKNIVRVPLIGKPLCLFFQGFCWLMLRTGVGKKLSTKTSHDYPLGYFMVAQKL
jgi:SAM-dependent methyltransferase